MCLADVWLPSSSKKTFNADSPSFTPSGQQPAPAKKSSALSSQAANAAPFTPRGLGGESGLTRFGVREIVDTVPATNLQQTAEATVFNPAAIREFTPQNYDISNTVCLPRCPSGEQNR